MRKAWLPLQIIGAVLVVALHAVPAQAQATRTWVSGVGDDANPCSRTAPCKTFAGAISKTAAGGEINVLDPGGFGAVTITKSISILSKFEASVLVSGTNGIIVQLGATTDSVTLEGLDFEGLGTGLDGLKITGTGTTTVRRCSFRHFTQNGIELAGTAGARLFLQDSILTNNGGATGGPGNGFKVSGPTNTAFIQNSVLDNNSNNSVNVIGATSTLVLIGTTLSGTGVSIAFSGGGQVISYGNNVIRGTGLPTSSPPLQ